MGQKGKFVQHLAGKSGGRNQLQDVGVEGSKTLE
jgi:hypothetical protein